MSRLPALAFTCALLAACATQAPHPETGAATGGADEVTTEKAERSIPADSLYPLLVAEFALRQRDYGLALEQYMEQSRLLRDAGLSAHTTHLTQFLQRENEAMQSAQLWVELAPDNVEANHTLAELLILKGRNVEAIPYLATVERNGGTANFPALMSNYGQLSDGQKSDLEHGITALSAEFPDNPQLMLTMALMHAENREYDRALDELDDLFAVEPEQPQALLLEARILVELEARNPYARLERVLRDNPDEKMLRLQYAGMLAATDMNAAREQFEILSAQAPQDADLLFSLALINREIGDSERASAYLRQIVALGRRTDEAYYYLGRIAEENGHPEQAIAYYQQVQDGEEYFAAVARIGQILVTAGDLGRSRDWFDRQRELHPGFSGQFYGLEADILTQAGYGTEAMTVLDDGLTALPDSMPLLYARAMLSEERDDLAAMERDLRAILARDPDNATALNALGYTLADRTTRYDEALVLITRAHELQPDEPAILDSMGWVLFRTGQHDEALTYLTRAYRDFPDAEVAAHLGEVLWVKGDVVAAREIWGEALERDPENPVLQGTLERLGVDLPAITPVGETPEGGD